MEIEYACSDDAWDEAVASGWSDWSDAWADDYEGIEDENPEN